MKKFKILNLKFTNRRGFTLIEILIVITLLAIMAVMIAGALNSNKVADKAYDAQRKKDLSRMRIAFEEYFNDKGCYPTQAFIDNLGCDGNGFAPWLSSWLCDPNKEKYRIATENSACPKWYKLMTNLQNRQDKEIPTGWYSRPGTVYFGNGQWTIDDVNYGLSSQNTDWKTESVPSSCGTQFSGCYVIPGPGRCGALAQGVVHHNAYVHPDCLPECMVSCCINGQICNQ